MPKPVFVLKWQIHHNFAHFSNILHRQHIIIRLWTSICQQSHAGSRQRWVDRSWVTFQVLLLIFNRNLIISEWSLGPFQFGHDIWVRRKRRLLHVAAEDLHLVLVPWRLWFALCVWLIISVGSFSLQDIFWFGTLVWWILRRDDRLVVFIRHSVLVEAFKPRGICSLFHFSFVNLEGIYLPYLRALVITVWWDYRGAGLFCGQKFILLVVVLVLGEEILLMLHVQWLGCASVPTLCENLWHPRCGRFLLVSAIGLWPQLQQPLWLSLDTYNAQILAFPDTSAWSHELACLALRTGLHTTRWRPTQRRSSPLWSWRDVGSLDSFYVFVGSEWAIVWFHILWDHNLKIKYQCTFKNKFWIFLELILLKLLVCT